MVNEYSTNINWILEKQDDGTFFISGWDKDSKILNIDSQIIEDSLNNREHQNSYIMSKDMYETKKLIVNNFEKNNYSINSSCFTIVANGTSAAFISLLQMFKRGIQNILFIGPIYFTYYHLIKMYHKKMFYWNINPFSELSIDFNLLENEINKNNIKCIIITLPFFGTGLTLDMKELEELSYICTHNNIFLIIDYVYGNMEWKTPNKLHNYYLVDMTLKSEYCILYESIPKRIFLNGMKSAIIYSTSDIIKQINKDSEICQGSISFIQESLLNSVYEEKNNSLLIKTLQKAVSYAQNNYYLIKSLLIDTDFLVCNSNSGYFSLIAIPTKHFVSKHDKDIAIEIYQKCKILTIPHSRYYYSLPNYYCFRINLSLETSDLIHNIKKLLYICNK